MNDFNNLDAQSEMSSLAFVSPEEVFTEQPTE